MIEKRLSRRYFFYGPLLAGAVPSGGFGSAASLPALGYKSVTDKLNIALIGVGMRGNQILLGAAVTENIAALCDVDETRLERASQTYPKAVKYKDFREMLDKEGKNIDAVMVATPDHLHTAVSLLSMQRGKHVYCEKPLTRTVSEARLLADAAARYKVATQMGNQGFSHEGTKTACEIVWSGEIGDVREVHAWTGAVTGGRLDIPETGLPEQPVPATLEWDLWLGPAAARPYNSLITRSWRPMHDFSLGGSLGDWLVHIMGPAHLALQLGAVFPTSVECVSKEPLNRWLWPWRAHTVFEFPARPGMPPVTVHLYQNMRGEFKNPPGMAENEALLPRGNNLAERGRPFIERHTSARRSAPGRGMQGRGAPGAGRGGRGPQPEDPALRVPGNGTVFVGSKGCLATSGRGEGVWLLPASRWADYKLPPQMIPRGVNHQQDWIRACKGGAPGVSQFPVTSKYLEWLALGTIAQEVSGKLVWDARNMRFSNSPEANKRLTPFTRRGREMKL
ncbi:MAG: Gfo/Idh/MocA family oxidoreductase [Acidobacteriia bacterium]|nr:Gfo/Idh/MocA family oxidoreductase [Terriglobia bacterium]